MNNEEKILSILAQMQSSLTQMQSDLSDVKAVQAEQGKQLAEQGKQLAEQGKQLAEQGKQLAEHSKQLAEQGKQLAEVRATQATQQSQLAELTEMQEELRTAVNRVAMAQERDTLPYLKLLDEGHHDIMRRLADKDRVEKLESDTRMLKTTAKNHAQRLAALEKAN